MVVLSLGGSLLFRGMAPDTRFMKSFSNILSGLRGVGVVVGGGTIARKYVDAAKKFSADNYDLDEIGISVTHANARLVATALQGARFFEHLDEAVEYLELHKGIAVMGGMFPGETTDTVAALMAEALGSRFVNLSNVDGVYDKNPHVFKGAKKYTQLTHKQLVKFAAEHDKRKPRENFVIDLLAAKILARSNIEAHFVNGRKKSDVVNAVYGKLHSGTRVID